MKKRCKRKTFDPFAAADKLMRRNCQVHDLHTASPDAPVRSDAALKLSLKIDDALKAFTHGTPVHKDWDLLAEIVNLVETLVTEGVVNSEAAETVKAATAALVGAGMRFDDGKGFRFDGQGLSAVREACEIYEYALKELDERTMLDMHQITKRRNDAKLKESGCTVAMVGT